MHTTFYRPIFLFLLLILFQTTQAQYTERQKSLRYLFQTVNANYGYQVDVDGDVAVVGAYLDDAGGFNDCGVAYVYHRNQGGSNNWGYVQTLLASDKGAGDRFSYSVGVSGDYIVIGAPNHNGIRGKAYVYYRNEGGTDNWGEQAKIVSSDIAVDDQFGYGVAIGGDDIVVGAHQEDPTGANNAGAAYVFNRNEGGSNNWGEVTKITASDITIDAWFGRNIAIDGDDLVISANKHTVGANIAQGKIYIFNRNEGGAENWGEVVNHVASNGAAQDQLGYFVDISGDNIVAGAFGYDDGPTNSVGAAYVFNRNEGGAENWGELTQLSSPAPSAFGNFGICAGIDGSRIVVGAYSEDPFGSSSGAAYVFDENTGGAGNWGLYQTIATSDQTASDRLGYGLAIDGSTIVVGAYTKVESGQTGAGAAYFFDDTPSPTIITSVSTVSGMLTNPLSASNTATYTVEGENLTADVDLTAPTGFEISLDGTNYSNSLTLSESGGDLLGEPVTIYARVPSAGTEGTNLNGAIQHTSVGASQVDVNADGGVLYLNRGNVLSFGNSFLDIPDIDELDGTESFTIDGWIKPISVGANMRLVSKFSGGTDRIEILVMNNGGLRLFVNRQRGTSPAASLSFNQWSHIAAVYDGTGASDADKIKIYINGVEQNLSFDAAETTPTITSSNNSILRIGGRSDDGRSPYSGELDELRIWETARTAEDLRRNMHLCLEDAPTGIVAYYQLNESGGTTSFDQISDYNGSFNASAPTRTVSTVNTGRDGASDYSVNVNAASTQNFTSANLVMDIASKTGSDDISVTYQAYTPNATTPATGVQIYDNPLWTINPSTTIGTHSSNLSFTFPANSFTNLSPGVYRLYNRPMFSDAAWTEIASVASNVTANTISFANVSSWGQFMVINTGLDLPVEWLNFEANRTAVDQVQLKWSTASELNNKGFEIQAWREAVEDDFEVVGWIDGQGTSTYTNYYEFMDENPYSGITHYRLKQIDFDGSYAFSTIRAVEGEQAELDFEFFPNPVVDYCQLRWGNLRTQAANLQIVDLNGKEIWQGLTITRPNESYSLPMVKDLPTGSYFIKIQLENGSKLSQKFIKS